jgi:hypothetical protein
MATPVFCCGFECGVTGTVGQHWTVFNSAVINTNTSFVRSGERSLSISGTATRKYFTTSAFSGQAVGVYRFYIYFASLLLVQAGILLVLVLKVLIVNYTHYMKVDQHGVQMEYL